MPPTPTSSIFIFFSFSTCSSPKINLNFFSFNFDSNYIKKIFDYKFHFNQKLKYSFPMKPQINKYLKTKSQTKQFFNVSYNF